MATGEPAAVNRPKRVRTGCLTCRERHLKCDEGTPDCLNCRKSSRVCKRGVRLNFIDIQTEQPPVMAISHEWKVHFQDESRDIASEYAGGISRYPPLTVSPPRKKMKNIPPPTPPGTISIGSMVPMPPVPTSHPTLPPILPLLPNPAQSNDKSAISYEDMKSRQAHSAASYPSYTAPAPPPLLRSTAQVMGGSPAPVRLETRRYLDNPEETLFMQVFVEEVGIWMDSLDPHKHFSRILPFSSLEEPMLLNAFLACGARHLTLVNPAYHEDKALHYYDTATRLILASLQNQNRDTEMCATTAVILNVYEVMSERALQRMNHIAGARALLRECGWNARTSGIGGACFWLNVTMELLSCLHFNWAVAWNPDEWGVDMDFKQRLEPGKDEIWAHRIIYILAKVANYKAASLERARRKPSTDPMYVGADNREHYEEWRQLREMCVSWNEHVPRSMHPMAYLHAYQTGSKSAFPEVWIIKRCTIVSRLFYHTAMVILAQINPYYSEEVSEMRELAMNHTHQICGIAAHVKDRGVASVALRSLATSAECLTVRAEQEEVLEIFRKIKKETGWRVDFVFKELKEIWGWQTPEPVQQPASLLQSSQMLHQHPNPPRFNRFQPRPPQQSPQQHQDLPPPPPPPPHPPPPPPPSFSQQQQQQQLQLQLQQPPQQQPAVRRSPKLVNPLVAVADPNPQTHPYHPHYVAAPQQQTLHGTRQGYM